MSDDAGIDILKMSIVSSQAGGIGDRGGVGDRVDFTESGILINWNQYNREK